MIPGELNSIRHCCPVQAGILVLVSVLLDSPSLAQQPSGGSPELTPMQLFVPAPRELVRPLTRASKAMRQQDYRQAVELLGEVLASQQQGDYLQPVPEDPFRSVSVHDEARRLLGQIPREHRVDYELRYEVTARQLLERAVLESDFSLLARVSRNYFYTEPGYQATLLLGHHYLEIGQPVSAASCFSLLIQDPEARQRFEPEVSVLLASCWLLSGNRAEAQATLEELAALSPQARVRLLDREVPLFSQPEQALDWLVDLIGSSTLAGYKSVDDWLMFRGNPERNASSGTGFPLPYARWYVPTVNNPQHERLAQQRYQNRLSNGESIIPALQPIAVGDTVVVRSLDQMVGIDIKTGKRVWEFPAWVRDSLMDVERQSQQVRQDRTEDWHVDQRMWRDHLYGQIASNGRQVFVIDQPGYAAPINQQSVVNRGFVIRSPVAGRVTNELKAVELARQGAFCWEVGGDTGGKVPELAGCFFLGPPLVLENELYILAELGGAIRLIVLAQQSGELLWSQQIAAIDVTHPVTEDRLRRLAGATPSASNNIVVCPTSAHGLVAVDRTTRSLLWGVQYPGAAAEVAGPQNPRTAALSSNFQSLDASITIAEGKVVLLPVESDRVLCYDLLSGRPAWSSPTDQRTHDAFGRPSEDAQFIACVVDSQIILVSADQLHALDLNTGDTLWRVSLGPYGRPSGRGFLTDRVYYLPTSDRKILQCDLTDGTIAGVVETRRVLGNLVCYRNELISQGHDVVSIYPQAEPIRQQLQHRLAEAAGEQLPAELLAWRAQLQAQDGDWLAAAETADQAFQLTGQSRERRLLMDLILGLMQSDYAAVRTLADKYSDELRAYGGFRYDAALFGGLLDEGAISGALTILRESGFGLRESGGMPADATDSYRHLENGALRIRLDAWLSHRLTQTGQENGANENRTNQKGANEKGATQSASQEEIRQWCFDASEDMPPLQLAAFVDLIGNESFPATALLRLARWQLSQKDLTNAEFTLHGLDQSRHVLATHSTQQQRSMHAAEVAALRIRASQEAGWQQRVRQQALQMLQRWPDVSFNDPWIGQIVTGRQLARPLLDRAGDSKSDATGGWNYGRVAGRMEATQEDSRFQMRTMAYPQLISLAADAEDDVRLEIVMQDAMLIVKDSTGQQIGQVAYRDNPDSRSFYTPRMYSGSYSLHGNLLVFVHGHDMIAVDLNLLKMGRRALLWQKNLQPEILVDNRLQFRTSYQAKPIMNPWGQNRFRIYDQGDPNPIGNFAANSRFVYCRVGKRIQCLDARSGEMIWQRSDLAYPGWLVADEEHVALLESSEEMPAAMYSTATLVNAKTGSRIKTVDLADYKGKSLWHSQGLKLLWSGLDPEPSLTLFDLNSEQEDWSRQWPARTHAVIRDPGTMVLVTAEGHLQYIDTESGQTNLEARLQPLPFRTFRLMKFRDRDLLLLNREDSNANVRDKDQDVIIRAALSGQVDLFNGWIYCLDRTQGELAWEHPARIEHFSVPLEHPIDTPLITLNRMLYPGLDSNRGRENLLEFYSLDLRDGRLVDVHRIRNWTLRSMQVTASADTQSVVHQFNDYRLTLQLTDDETPPAAPASLTSQFTIPRARRAAAGDQETSLSIQQQQLIRRARERIQDE